MKTISTKEMTKLDWLEARKKGLGGSDVATVLGLNPYKTQRELWENKMNPDVVEEEINDAMHFGDVLESVIAEEYVRRTGQRVQKDNKIRIHPEHSFLLANIDRLIIGNGNGPGILEAKTASSFAYKNWTDEIPLPYYCQLMHYLAVTGYKWGEFAILVDGRKFETIPIKRDDIFIEKQNKALIDWWNEYIIGNTPPPLEAKEITELRSVENSIEAESNILDSYASLISVKPKLKKLKEEQTLLENEIKVFMGDNDTLSFEGEILATFKSYSQNRFDTKAFQVSNEALFKLYNKETQTRRFSVKELK